LSERWWRRRKKKRPWFNDFFDEFDRLERMTDEIMWKAFETASERAKVRRPYVYGFPCPLDLIGKPVIRVSLGMFNQVEGDLKSGRNRNL